MPNVTVVGASGAIVTVPFTGSANYVLASQLAAIINGAASPSVVPGGSGNLNATNYPTVPTGGGLTEEVVSVSGAVVPASSGTNFLTDIAAGAVTVAGSPFLNVIAGTGGLTFLGAASGNTSIAAGGGTNLIQLPNGSSYFVALGSGTDTVDANGTGTVDASGGGGPNLIFTSQYSNNQNVVFSAGTGDTIVAGAGATTIGESGSNATIFLGTGPDLVALGGSGDTVSGATVAGAQTVFGGANSVIFGNANTLTFVAGAGDADTISGGVKDTIFGSTGSNVSWEGGSTAATLSAGAGNETLNGSNSTQADVYIGSSGATTISLGSGADTLQFFNGKAGGTDFVTGFTSNDTLSDIGYGGAAPTVTTSGGSTVVSLSDGTKITLSNFTSSSFIKGS